MMDEVILSLVKTKNNSPLLKSVHLNIQNLSTFHCANSGSAIPDSHVSAVFCWAFVTVKAANYSMALLCVTDKHTESEWKQNSQS